MIREILPPIFASVLLFFSVVDAKAQFVPNPALTAIPSSAQKNVTMTGATALTIPIGATTALISVSGTNNGSGICAYWEDDGTNPTTSAGQPLASLGFIYFHVNSLPIKLIQASGASCTFNANFYR